MERLFEAARPIARGVVRYDLWVLLGALLLTVGGAYWASGLRIDSDIANLLPEDYPSVQALETLQRTVGGEREVAVAIQSPSFEANKAFAEDLIPKALALAKEEGAGRYLSRVEYKRDVEFLSRNALYFASDEELRQVEQFLDDAIQEAKLRANPFYVDLGLEEEAESSEPDLDQIYDRLVGTEYPISADSTVMALRFFPTGATTDIEFIRRLYADLDSLVQAMEPSSYHPEMSVTLAGRLYRQLAEVEAIQADVQGSFGVGVATVLLVVVLYFLYKSYRARAGATFSARILLTEIARLPVMALVIGLPLLMSLCWTGGVAYLAYGELNLMTSTLGLVLFGLGIDFGIHFYGRYAEERGAGRSVAAAAEQSFVRTGQAIAASALTTAAAFYVLVAADFRGFSEFGFIAGTGLLFALVAMIFVLPALLSLLERGRLLSLRAEGVAMQVPSEAGRFPRSRLILLGSVGLVLLAFALIPTVEFEYDFGALEPTYERYQERARAVDPAVTLDPARRNPAYVVTDSPEAAPKVARAVRERMRSDTTSPTILAVETLQERFPLSDTAQQRKLKRIAEIRETLEQSPYLQQSDAEGLNRLRHSAQTREPIETDQLPDFLRDRFRTKAGEIGTLVIIYPSVGLSDGRRSIAFAQDVGTITTSTGATYHAGSTSLVAADMLRLMQQEAPWMIGATLLVVLLLMVLDFGSLRWAAVGVVPLVVGIAWMLLVMAGWGLKFNFYNLIVLPAVLGIGEDAGVHLTHRYREEGPRSLPRVLRSTGEHVSMSALTTMIGFGGLLLSFHPGLRSIGLLAVVGIGTTWLASILVLPALLQWLEDNHLLGVD